MSLAISKFRNKAYREQNGRCYYCGHPMWVDAKSNFADQYDISEKQAKWFQCTAEHLKARCDGGQNSQENIVAACKFCNEKRHLAKKPYCPSEYKIKVKKRLSKGRWNSTLFARNESNALRMSHGI